MELNQKGDVFDQLMLEYAHEDGNGPIGFYALHRAVKRGDLNLVHILTSRGYDVNAFDADGYTPLTLAARGGKKGMETEESGMFHVVTTKNNEVHFVCDGGIQMADLWVRGILLVTSEAIFGKPKQV
ncbi:hypothetical protein Goshw_002153 [Gossypium schwendimanii]|uniref:Uncharacterized protein n=1 Tax=Gossypium schwendimanii TaxID=34291 RepID=A0A7J9KPP4_GOSSC|nr:hypothetical protein [Gossypium schwendimanii]